MKQISIFTFILLINISGVNSQTGLDKKIFEEPYIKKTMRRALDWQLKHPKHELYQWTNGAFYAGVFAAYQTLGSKEIYKAIYKMGEANQWKPGPRVHHADDHAICQTYIDMYRIAKEEKMIKPFIQTMEEFMAIPFDTSELKRCTWYWSDALFMAPAAFVKLGVTLNEEKYLKLNDRLFKEAYDFLYDKDEHLYAYNIYYLWDEPGIEKRKESNGEKIFWSRGNGWAIAGLVRVLQELPENFPTRSFYIQNYKEMVEKIVSIQQTDGLWRTSLLDPASYPDGEASGSGFYTYALAWGINNGFLDKETYMPVAEKAWAGMISLIQPDGRVGWVQPPGGNPRRDFSADSWEVYGTGAFLLAGSEVIKLRK